MPLDSVSRSCPMQTREGIRTGHSSTLLCRFQGQTDVKLPPARDRAILPKWNSGISPMWNWTLSQSVCPIWTDRRGSRISRTRMGAEVCPSLTIPIRRQPVEVGKLEENAPIGFSNSASGHVLLVIFHGRRMNFDPVVGGDLFEFAGLSCLLRRAGEVAARGECAALGRVER